MYRDSVSVGQPQRCTQCVADCRTDARAHFSCQPPPHFSSHCSAISGAFTFTYIPSHHSTDSQSITRSDCNSISCAICSARLPATVHSPSAGPSLEPAVQQIP